MSFLLTFLIGFATSVAVAMTSVREFFMTSDAAGYAFVAINCSLLLVATALFALLLKLIENYFLG